MSSDPVKGVVPPNGGGAAAAADAPSAEAVEESKSAAEPQHFLQRIKLFSALSVDDCQQVVKRMKRRDFLPNQLIVREGAPGSSMFFITAGLVEIRKKDPHTGIDFLLSEMGPGQNFGEMALLTGKPRTASVTSVQPTTCAVLEQADFHDLLMQYPKIGLALTTVLAERVENASQHVGIEFINLAKMHFDPRVLGLLPQTMMLQHKVIPVAFFNNRLTLAMVNPNNIIALDDVRRIIKGVMIEPVVTTEEDFKKFMSTTYQPAHEEGGGQVRHGRQHPPRSLAAPPVSSEAMIDLLQSDLIRDLQLAEDNSRRKQAGPDDRLRGRAHHPPRQFDARAGHQEGRQRHPRRAHGERRRRPLPH